jgi:hypothetical protein
VAHSAGNTRPPSTRATITTIFHRYIKQVTNSATRIKEYPLSLDQDRGGGEEAEMRVVLLTHNPSLPALLQPLLAAGGHRLQVVRRYRLARRLVSEAGTDLLIVDTDHPALWQFERLQALLTCGVAVLSVSGSEPSSWSRLMALLRPIPPV